MTEMGHKIITVCSFLDRCGLLNHGRTLLLRLYLQADQTTCIGTCSESARFTNVSRIVMCLSDASLRRTRTSLSIIMSVSIS